MGPLRVVDRSSDVRAYLPLVPEALERIDAELRRFRARFRSVGIVSARWSLATRQLASCDEERVSRMLDGTQGAR